MTIVLIVILTMINDIDNDDGKFIKMNINNNGDENNGSPALLPSQQVVATAHAQLLWSPNITRYQEPMKNPGHTDNA